jgi:protein-L-isoaspartate(D-aspartate) O-methyltransferase
VTIDDDRRREREAMVVEQIEVRGVADPAVLDALRRVPRHRFVPEELQGQAYADRALPIGHGGTISQPFVVARMSELAGLRAGQRVLDVGTGSGYQAAVACALGAAVWGIELEPTLAREAGERLATMGWPADVVPGDGWRGRPEHAPYDVILVAAAASEVPPALVEQLALGGRVVVPVGGPGAQALTVVTRDEQGTHVRAGIPVAFIPLRRP